MGTGHEHTANELETLLSTYPPPFIHVHNPHTPRISAVVARNVLDSLKATSNNNDLCLATAAISAISCYTPRLLYDTVINQLAEWTPTWEDGCANWSGPEGQEGQRFNESIDGFLHGLRAVGIKLQREAKGREYRLVLFVEHAEKLAESMPDLLVPLSRVAELAQLDVVTILHSHLPWDQLKPPLGAAPDPYYIDIPPLSTEDTLAHISSSYPSPSLLFDQSTALPTTSGTPLLPSTLLYHPALRSLHSHFLNTLHSICSPFTTDPDELAYIGAAAWTAFGGVWVREWQRLQEEEGEDDGEGVGGEYANTHTFEQDEPQKAGKDKDIEPPPTETLLRLTRLLAPSISSALQTLLPRSTHALAWSITQDYPPNLLNLPITEARATVSRLASTSTTKSSTMNDSSLSHLPRLAKYVLLAAFLASTNPPKTDLRMFGRGPEDRKKRKGGGTRKGRMASGAEKVPQRLLGPLPFPQDRLLAILYVLLEENEPSGPPPSYPHDADGEEEGTWTEVELARVGVYAIIQSLTTTSLLIPSSHSTTTSTSETKTGGKKLDPSPVYRCGINFDCAVELAREVGVALFDFMWEGM